MKTLELNQLENFNGGQGGTACFFSPFAVVATCTSLLLAYWCKDSVDTVVDCWNDTE